jgi:hypothetical protein
MRKLMTCLLGVSGLVAAAQAYGSTTLLTFDGATDPNPQPACANYGGPSGPTNGICSVETFKLGNNYGSSAELAISYARTINVQGGTAVSPELIFLYADGNGVGSSFGDVNNAGLITFTPAAGYEVSFGSFDFVDRNSGSRSATFSLTDSLGNSVFNFTSPVLRQRTTYTADTAFFSGPLSFVFDGIGASVPSVDNVLLTTRRIAVNSAVPEPATWAMMIGGFGMIGGAMRRGRQTRVFARA